MNQDCHQTIAKIIATLPPPKRVVEFGSLNVNGGICDLLGGAGYVGVDILSGPGVTVVADAATYSPPWQPDLVICLNMLEHVTNAKAIIANAWRILAPGGTLIMDVPDDTWPQHGASGGVVHANETYKEYTPEMVLALMAPFGDVMMKTRKKLIYAKGTKAPTLSQAADTELHLTADKRLNIGCGYYGIEEWTNLDSDPTVGPDVCADAIEYLSERPGEFDEIYAGHFLEHLTQEDAQTFLVLCYESLKPGGRLGILVPDSKEVMRRYVMGSVDAVEYPLNVWLPIADIDTLNSLFIYSTVQASPHRWMWDHQSLSTAMKGAGFGALREIDRHRDVRLGSARWFQFGFDGWKQEGD